jgi:hypothetical protein
MTTTINHLDDTRHHAGVMDDTAPPDPEVPERSAGRRQFSPTVRLVGARAGSRPRGQVTCRWELGHIRACLGDEHIGHADRDSRDGHHQVPGASKRGDHHLDAGQARRWPERPRLRATTNRACGRCPGGRAMLSRVSASTKSSKHRVRRSTRADAGRWTRRTTSWLWCAPALALRGRPASNSTNQSSSSTWATSAGQTWSAGSKPPMRRAVAFARSIKDSQRVTRMFNQIVDDYAAASGSDSLLQCEVDHVDGTFNALQRNEKLDWLKEPTEGSICRILSNARCLSEGVDVPALNAVMFLNPRNSVVDVVQSVGRVMRRAPGKEYGYVVLPIGVPSDWTPEEALKDNQKYKVVWQVPRRSAHTTTASTR